MQSFHVVGGEWSVEGAITRGSRSIAYVPNRTDDIDITRTTDRQ
jgi:hypothetical protein